MGNVSGRQLVIVCNDERGMACYGRKDLLGGWGGAMQEWPVRIWINNSNLPSIHVIRKQTRTKDNQQSKKKTSHFIEIYFELILIIKLAQRSNILGIRQR